MVVHAHIANVSGNATVKWAYTANALVNKILQGLDEGDALPFTIRIGDSDITPSYYPEGEIESESSDLADSSIALISIAMFVVGVLVGVVAMVLTYVIITRCCKRKSSVEFGGGAGSSQSESAAKYERQIDDVVADDAD